MDNTKNNFSQFTNLYSLSKTLRFELKPIGNTQKMLDDADIFGKDKIRQDKYKQTKPFFDELHRDFIKECLQDKKIDDLDDYFKALQELQENKKDKKIQDKFKKISQQLRTQINNYFKKNNLFSILFNKNVFEELKKRYGTREDSFLRDKDNNFILNKDNKKISIFDEWKNFTGYFTKFQKTRENFYKDDGTATAIATRIVDQNLKRFCENLQLFNDIKNKIDFSEVETNFFIKLKDIFSLDYYNFCLLQDGINKYNKILGGETKKSGKKLKGLNEIINKYKQDNKSEKVKFFKLLDKQILSEKEEFIENIKDNKELLKYLKKFYKSAGEKIKNLESLLNTFFNNLDDYNLEKVYLSKEALNTILYKWMSYEGRIEFQKNAFILYKKSGDISFDKNKDEYKFSDFISFDLIRKVLNSNFASKIWKERYFTNEKNKKECITENQTKFKQFIFIFRYEFNSLFEKQYIQIINGKDIETKTGYNIFKKDFQKILNRDTTIFSTTPEDKITIKNFVDNTLWIYQMGKYFALEKKRKWLDEYDVDSDFYNNPNYGFKNKFYDNAYEKIIKTRMLIQSYLTKKPFDTNKWKLNFNHPKLLQGFTESRTDKSNNGTQYGAYILRQKKGSKCKYFLGVSKNPKLLSFFDEINETDELSEYERLNYYQIKTNSIYGTSYEGNYQEDKHNLSELEIINKIKKSLSSYISRITMVQEIIKKEYTTIKEIKTDIDLLVKKNGHLFEYKPISKKQFQKTVASKNLFYLFEVRVKDFNSGSNGNKNLHTLYFEELISGKSQKIDIGNGEIFYRPETKDFNPPHIITKENKLYIEKQGKKILHKKRYLTGKSFLHLSITLNADELDVPKKEKAKRAFCYKFNQEVNEFLVDNPEINIIGIDRGEKHLIYYAGINQNGDILKDKDNKFVIGSLNKIKGVDYHKLLEERAKNREKAKQDWQNIEGIKDLKKGYLSLVVRKLADLMIEHNAIIVLEDLNMRFKQIRGGIEKSVYQQLEKALISKLNFLVNKGETDPQKAGHLLKAYQLTAPFTTFQDMGKQTGMIFYTQASYTSKTCPVCGFRPNINWNKEDVINNNKINISYHNNYFVISYSLPNNKIKSKRNNVLYTNKTAKNVFELKTKDVIRYKWFARNKKDSELSNGMQKITEETGKGITIKYDITECLKNLFKKENINYKGDIMAEMKEKIKTKKFYKELSFLLYLLSNTRNSISGKNIDIINCPACGFNSEDGFQGCHFNGDANGAYNIARKGIIILEKLKQFKQDNSSLEKMNWGDLFIGIEEWDKFTQSQK